MLTDSQILKITQPEALFPDTEATAKIVWRKLVAQWHPDRNPNVNPLVLPHINTLYDKVLLLIANDTWTKPSTVRFKSVVNFQELVLTYKSKRTFDLGEIYVGATFISYAFTKDNGDLVSSAVKMIKGLTFSSPKMSDEISRFLPNIWHQIETADRHVLIFRKTADQFLLSDVLDHYKGAMPATHVAWVVSRLYNLCCYLTYSKIMHAGILVDCCLISPQHHTISLVGGWWFSTKVGAQMVALPTTAITYCSTAIITAKVATPLIDRELLRALARKLLGDESGSKLTKNSTIPSTLVNFLRAVPHPTISTYEEYDQWQTSILIKSFGKRKFTEMIISESDVYVS